MVRILTYQTKLVLDTLRSGEIYRAEKSLNYGRAYACLIDMLKLDCKCPIFGCLKYRRQCADGRGASSVLLELKVPDEKVWLTEYSVWADFLYDLRYTNPANYKKVAASSSSELSQIRLDQMIHSLRTQNSPWRYKVPQAVLEKIRPEWVLKYQIGNYGIKQRL